ncbi:hypothetical protein O9992_11945 [Vibrio lentus]|nr:hypothetical protein [Vibrio lentus]
MYWPVSVVRVVLILVVNVPLPLMTSLMGNSNLEAKKLIHSCFPYIISRAIVADALN